MFLSHKDFKMPDKICFRKKKYYCIKCILSNAAVIIIHVSNYADKFHNVCQHFLERINQTMFKRVFLYWSPQRERSGKSITTLKSYTKSKENPHIYLHPNTAIKIHTSPTFYYTTLIYIHLTFQQEDL